MEEKKKFQKFTYYGKAYNKVTIFMIGLSVMLIVLGYMFVQAMTSAPIPIIYLATFIFYYHIGHFLIGLTLLLFYLVKSKKYSRNVKIANILLSIIFTPVSFIIVYIAILLLSLSSCVE